jgi:hypothetical protein
MKTIMRLLPFMAGMLMLVSCEAPSYQAQTNQPQPVIPVNADFTTTFYKDMVWEGYKNLAGPVCQMMQIGSGTDVELGNFNILLSCCWSLSACVPGRSGGYLTDGKGSTIYINCRETLAASDLTTDFPPDQTAITGTFEFISGTGRFEGASGNGSITSFVNNGTITHRWEGSVRFIKPD